MLGTYALSAGYYDAYYGKAQKVRTLIVRDFAAAYEQFDVLLSPTSPTTAFPFGAKTADPLAMYLNDVCTIPSNLAGHPAMSRAVRHRRRRPAGRRAGAGAGARRGDDVPGRRRARGRRARAPSADDRRSTALARRLGAGDRASRCTPSWPPPPSCSAACPNHFGDEPNTNIDPVTPRPARLAAGAQRAGGRARHPPRPGAALHGRSRRSSHRKNYFYPDMPKDYQISQYDQPINVDGWLELPDGTRIGIERAHLEEDTGKSTHVGGGGGRIHGADVLARRLQPRRRAAASRSSSRPDIRTAEQARPYVERAAGDPRRHRRVRRQDGGGLDARRRQRLGAPARRAAFGTRCEIKNLNSLRSLGRAIEYEARRQIDLLEAGERSARRPATGTRPTGRTAHAALEGGRRRLPLLPRARPGAARARRRVDRRDRAPALPVLPAERRARAGRGRRRRRRRPRRSPSPSSAASTSSPSAAIAAGADAGRVLTHVEHNLAVDGADALAPAHARRARSRMETDGELTATQAKTVLAEMVADRAATRGHRRGQGLRGDGRRRPRRRGRRRDPPPTPTSGSGSAPATTRPGASSPASSSARSCRPPRARPTARSATALLPIGRRKRQLRLPGAPQVEHHLAWTLPLHACLPDGYLPRPVVLTVRRASQHFPSRRGPPMPSPTLSRPGRLAAAAVIAAVAVTSLVGCGASTGAVKSANSKKSLTAPAEDHPVAPTDIRGDHHHRGVDHHRSIDHDRRLGDHHRLGRRLAQAAKQQFLEQCEGGDASKAPDLRVRTARHRAADLGGAALRCRQHRYVARRRAVQDHQGRHGVRPRPELALTPLRIDRRYAAAMSAASPTGRRRFATPCCTRMTPHPAASNTRTGTAGIPTIFNPDADRTTTSAMRTS